MNSILRNRSYSSLGFRQISAWIRNATASNGQTQTNANNVRALLARSVTLAANRRATTVETPFQTRNFICSTLLKHESTNAPPQFRSPRYQGSWRFLTEEENKRVLDHLEHDDPYHIFYDLELNKTIASALVYKQMIAKLCKARKVKSAFDMFNLVKKRETDTRNMFANRNIKMDVNLVDQSVYGLLFFVLHLQSRNRQRSADMASELYAGIENPSFAVTMQYAAALSKAGDFERLKELYDTVVKNYNTNDNTDTNNTTTTTTNKRPRLSLREYATFLRGCHNYLSRISLTLQPPASLSASESAAATHNSNDSAAASFEFAFELFDALKNNGIEPDSQVYCSLLLTCTLMIRMITPDISKKEVADAKHKHFLERIQQLLDEVNNRIESSRLGLGGVEQPLPQWKKQRQKQKQRQVTGRQDQEDEYDDNDDGGRLHKNINLYNALLNFYAEIGNELRTQETIQRMIENGVEPDMQTIDMKMKIHVKTHNLGNITKLEEYLRRAEQQELSSLSAHNREATPRDLLTRYNTLINSCARRNGLEKAIEYLREMINEKGIIPNDFTATHFFNVVRRSDITASHTNMPQQQQQQQQQQQEEQEEEVEEEEKQQQQGMWLRRGRCAGTLLKIAEIKFRHHLRVTNPYFLAAAPSSDGLSLGALTALLGGYATAGMQDDWERILAEIIDLIDRDHGVVDWSHVRPATIEVILTSLRGLRNADATLALLHMLEQRKVTLNAAMLTIVLDSLVSCKDHRVFAVFDKYKTKVPGSAKLYEVMMHACRITPEEHGGGLIRATAYLDELTNRGIPKSATSVIPAYLRVLNKHKKNLQQQQQQQQPQQEQQPSGQHGASPGVATNLFVRSLPQTATNEELTTLFSPFGGLISAHAVIDKAAGSCKGFGFVRYDNPVSAQMAISAMNGYQLGKKQLQVRLKMDKPAETNTTGDQPETTSSTTS